ncbi:MAG: hypothetical protein HY821_22430 [Acidobacteria bacterium]|nr:hypothetical protein [Acidobacteriota bacterium]
MKGLPLLLISMAFAAEGGDPGDYPAYALPPTRAVHDGGYDPMQSRLFATTRTRLQINLAGYWQFRTDPSHEGEARHFADTFPAETTLWVPGTWNVHPRYSHYVGAAWLRRSFEVPVAGHLRIRFGAVLYRASVWLDGELLGSHEGGYTPFSFAVANARAGTHVLTVRADNTLSEATVPKQGVDWFAYGGIDRPVYVEVVPAAWIEAFDIVPKLLPNGSADVRAKIRLRNVGPAKREKIRLEIDGAVQAAGTFEIGPGETTVVLETSIAKPRLWSPAGPELYSARAVVGESLDDQFTRFGVRSIRIDGPRILLNEKPFKLRGVNRHEDHPDWGSALPPYLLRRDFEIIKSIGANAVRGHYPPSEMFLDYCDEGGLAFMDEVPAWQSGPAQLSQPEVQESIRRAFREMVARDANHPSVITWSLGNEWLEPDRCYTVARSLLQYARTVDSSRPLLLVTSDYSGKLHELVDVIATNWGLYDWYDPATQPEDSLSKKSLDNLRRIHETYPDKPLILSEFGGAESQPGWHDWSSAKWSEEFQARNVTGSGSLGLSESWLSGGCVWQFADSRSAPERILAGRLHGWNGKGILDEYRRPKTAYFDLRRLYRSFAAK